MMTSDTTLDLVNLDSQRRGEQIERYNYLKKLGLHLENLESNLDFKALINDAFLAKKAEQTIKALANSPSQNVTDMYHRDLMSISILKNWLQEVKNAAKDADNQLAILLSEVE